MPDQKGYPEDFFIVNKVIAAMCGLWRPSSKDYGYLIKAFYYMYCTAIYGIAVTFIVCEFIRFSETIKETSLLLNHIGLLFSHLVGIAKLYRIIVYKDKILDAIEILHDKKYCYDTYKDFSPGNFVTNRMRFSWIFSVGTFVSYSAIGVLSHIRGRNAMHRETEYGQFGANHSCYDYLSFAFEIPFPADNAYICEYALAYMNAGLGFNAFVIAFADGFFVTATICLCAHLLVLSNVFKTLRPRCLLKLGLPDTLELIKDDELPMVEEEMYNDLTGCIDYLLALFKIWEAIEEVGGILILLQAMISMVIIAANIFVASKVSISSPEFGSQLQYLYNILVQLFIICYFGNEITVSSEHIGTSLYESNWYSASSRYKKSIILTMCRMQKSMCVTVAKFAPLTLSTFVSILKSSFSYLALFQNMQ